MVKLDYPEASELEAMPLQVLAEANICLLTEALYFSSIE